MHRLALVALVAMVAACGGSGGSGGGGGGSNGCSSANCTGCCFNDACQTGNTASACGKGGGSCFQCINGAVCKTDQTCGIDPNSTWRIQPASATVTTKNGGAADWDFGGGAPDPYAVLYCPAGAAMATATTTAATDTFTPTWSTTSAPCTMTASALQSTGFGFAMLDDDVTTPDTIVALSTVKTEEAHLLQGFIEFNAAGNLQALRINLIRQ